MTEPLAEGQPGSGVIGDAGRLKLDSEEGRQRAPCLQLEHPSAAASLPGLEGTLTVGS